MRPPCSSNIYIHIYVFAPLRGLQPQPWNSDRFMTSFSLWGFFRKEFGSIGVSNLRLARAHSKCFRNDNPLLDAQNPTKRISPVSNLSIEQFLDVRKNPEWQNQTLNRGCCRFTCGPAKRNPPTDKSWSTMRFGKQWIFVSGGNFRFSSLRYLSGTNLLMDLDCLSNNYTIQCPVIQSYLLNSKMIFQRTKMRFQRTLWSGLVLLWRFWLVKWKKMRNDLHLAWGCYKDFINLIS